jgi:hypothetical protein
VRTQPLKNKIDEVVAPTVFQVPCGRSDLHRAPGLDEVT